uniref:DIX domain-containing protein n=1 Tax=Syphacia muris TaxID=451379 RepID=A0A0N5AGF1_9BILA
MDKEVTSVDVSATSNSIIDMASRLRIDDEGPDAQETTSTGVTSSGVIEASASVSDESSSVLPTAQSSEQSSALTTKVYYHIDVEEMPYCTEVQVPPDKITLGDFKRMLNRSNYKYYCKAPSPDPAVFSEVKVELRDDDEPLRRSAKGHFELFLQTTEGSTHSDGSSGPVRLSHHHIVPGPAPTRYPLDTLTYRRAVQQFDQSLASTDSESIISEMQALPTNLRTGISRRQYQPHYLLQSWFNIFLLFGLMFYS